MIVQLPFGNPYKCDTVAASSSSSSMMLDIGYMAVLLWSLYLIIIYLKCHPKVHIFIFTSSVDAFSDPTSHLTHCSNDNCTFIDQDI